MADETASLGQLLPPPAGDEAPKRGPGRPRKAAPKDAAPKGPGRPTTRDRLEGRIAETYDAAGAAMAFAGTLRGSEKMAGVGVAVSECSPAAAAAWAKLCEDNPKIRAAWEKILTGTGWGAVVQAHLPIMFAVLAAFAREDAGEDATPGPADEKGPGADGLAA